jgi:hypothetical protein
MIARDRVIEKPKTYRGSTRMISDQEKAKAYH